jgi:predicted dehydrogenase
MTKQIRAAVIGTGGISGAHLNFLKSRKDAEIVALCDVNAENLERRQKEYGGQAFADFEQMLDETKPDAVWLCTPPQVRREPILACARRRIPVFCEKPVGRDAAYTARVAAEFRRARAIVQVGYVFRSIPAVKRLRELMADDQVYAVQSFYGCSMSVARSSRAWFYVKELSGGALIDQATHNLDLLRCLFGEVKDVRGLSANPRQRKTPGYTIEEVIGVTLRFANGMIGSHLHTWLGDRWRNEIFISGVKRGYRLNLNQGVITVEEGAETRAIQQPAGPIHNYQNELFLDMVRSGDWSANPSAFDDALKSLRLTLACDEAATKAL